MACVREPHGAARERSRGESNPAEARESGETRETVRRESACFLVVKYSNTCPPTGWRVAGRQRRALHLQRGAQARAAGGGELTPPARAWGKRSRRPGHSGWRGFLVRRLAAGSLRHGMHAAALPSAASHARPLSVCRALPSAASRAPHREGQSSLRLSFRPCFFFYRSALASVSLAQRELAV